MGQIIGASLGQTLEKPLHSVGKMCKRLPPPPSPLDSIRKTPGFASAMNREEHGVRVIALIHCSNSIKWRFEMVYGAILGNDLLVCAFISPHHCHNSTDI